MTEAVVYWQTLCMIAVSSVVEVPGFATDAMGLAKNPTMAVSKTTKIAASLLPTPTIETFVPSLNSLLSDSSFLISQTAHSRNYLASEVDNIVTPTNASSRASETPSSGSSSSLSTGAKAGIAVGVVSIALAAALGVWLLCRRHRRSKVAAPVLHVGTSEGYSEKTVVTTTTQQIEPANHPNSSIQPKPVQHGYVYPEVDGRSTVNSNSAPHGAFRNELEGQYWPVAHERRGELPG